MEARIDSAGRVQLPEQLREDLGLRPGSVVEISAYGLGIAVVPGGPTARVEKGPNGYLVGTGSGTVTDEDVLTLIDAGRR